jgi:DNA helicase-2/ATP-dependent DNA helicase PcrA
MSVKIKEAEKIFGPPGTGKTRRLITKVSWLINEKKIDPEDICYITFTNKGIDEVRERLKVTKKTDGYESFATIHGLCNGF